MCRQFDTIIAAARAEQVTPVSRSNHPLAYKWSGLDPEIVRRCNSHDELLDALKRLCAVEDGSNTDWPDLWNQALDAIAKAEGK